MKKNIEIKKWASKLKYIIALVAFGVIIIFLDENNLIKRYKNARNISSMENEIQQCKRDSAETTRRLYLLRSNPRYIEQIAREKYLMKKPNEDVFVVENRTE